MVPFAKETINAVLNGEKKNLDLTDIQILCLANYKFDSTSEKFKAAIDRDKLQNSVPYQVWLKQIYKNNGFGPEYLKSVIENQITNSVQISTAESKNVYWFEKLLFSLFGWDITKNKILSKPTKNISNMPTLDKSKSEPII